MGTREVTLIGGEAYMRRDWLKIIREIREKAWTARFSQVACT